MPRFQGMRPCLTKPGEVCEKPHAAGLREPRRGRTAEVARAVSTETSRLVADIRTPGAACSMALPAAAGQNSLDILIYEEDALTRALLQEWLAQAGYRIRFGRPHDATLDAPADLVIVNVYMPKQTGAQWVRAIQAAHPDTPFIAISGQFRSGLCCGGATAQGLGVQQVIAKPLSRTDLLDTVRGMIGLRH